mgnify:CR=1 FL=1
MILYSDKYTKKLESERKWIDSIRYLHEKWALERENTSLFLKLSVNIWYTLTLDGPELSLGKEEYDTLTQMLCNCLVSFQELFPDSANCQWLFGYMMEVRTDLFLKSEWDFTAIESAGKALIEEASHCGNIFAQLLFALDRCPKIAIKRKRREVNAHISEYFDASQEVDQYFIEILGE